MKEPKIGSRGGSRAGADRSAHEAKGSPAEQTLAGERVLDPLDLQRRFSSGPVAALLVDLGAMAIDLDGEGRIGFVSDSSSLLIGREPGQCVGHPMFDWIHEEDRPELIELYQKSIETMQLQKARYRCKHGEGHWVWLEATSFPYRDPGGYLRRLAFIRDISEKERIDQARQASESRFRALAENATDLIAEIDEAGVIVFVSPNSGAQIGLDSGELQGRHIRDVDIASRVHPDDLSNLKAVLERFEQERPAALESELRFRHPDGTWRWLDCRATVYRTGGQRRAVVIARDVSERIRSQQALRESEERYRIVAETSLALICETDEEGRILYASPTHEQVLGYRPEELVGTTSISQLHPDEAESVVEYFIEEMGSEEPLGPRHFRVRHKDGSWRWLEGAGLSYRTAGGALHFLAVNQDVTQRRTAEVEQRRIEQSLQQARKLESLGVLAGGVAHDFNNLLTPILGDLSLALADLPTTSPVRSRLERVYEAAGRAAALTHQMLDYAGQRPLVMAPVDVSQLVAELEGVISRSVGVRIERESALPADLPAVRGDGAQLQQVVTNLVTNAAEALGDGAGRISIRTGIVAGRELRAVHSFLPSEPDDVPCVFLEVADTGCGMDGETASCIFDPFFTTKFTGRGLGLAAVLGIVRGHRGAIEVSSEPGVGTRVRVAIAVGTTTARAGLLASEAPLPVGADCSKLLVVDDDEGVLEITEETLLRGGFDVVAVSDGREAVRLFGASPDEFAAVLLDWTMPSISGREVLEEVQAICPGTQVILMSGYPVESISGELSGALPAHFLQKPFLPSTLLDRVRDVLSAKS